MHKKKLDGKNHFFMEKIYFEHNFEKYFRFFRMFFTQILDPKQTGLHCKPSKLQVFVPVDIA